MQNEGSSMAWHNYALPPPHFETFFTGNMHCLVVPFFQIHDQCDCICAMAIGTWCLFKPIWKLKTSLNYLQYLTISTNGRLKISQSRNIPIRKLLQKFHHFLSTIATLVQPHQFNLMKVLSKENTPSPYLFIIFLGPFLWWLEKDNIGYHIPCTTTCNTTTYVDDLAIVTYNITTQIIKLQKKSNLSHLDLTYPSARSRLPKQIKN